MGLTFSLFQRRHHRTVCFSHSSITERSLRLASWPQGNVFQNPHSPNSSLKFFILCLKIKKEKLQSLEARAFTLGTTKGSWKSQQPSADWGLLSVGHGRCSKRARGRRKTNKTQTAKQTKPRRESEKGGGGWFYTYFPTKCRHVDPRGFLFRLRRCPASSCCSESVFHQWLDAQS